MLGKRFGRHYCTMPPKKKAGEPSKKNQEKKKEKVIEDKTFGLKNKKGKKQQEFVKHVTQQVKHGGNPAARKTLQEQEKKKLEQEAKKKEKEEIIKLFKPVNQKVPAGADPQSVVCAFFKQGQCSKGDKCKFSHDLSLDRKGEKRSMYVDQRDAEDELENDTMDKWDQDKLEQVIEKKHGAKEKCMPKTDIVCKYFLEAVDKGLYGWFWSCPNSSSKCIYRHALPPGFVLKKKQEKMVKEEISIEEFIETARKNLGANLTKVTLESFLKWKQRKLKEKKAAFEKDQEKKKDEFKSGRIVGKVSGREVFQFKPELVGADADDDEQAEDMSIYRTKDDDDGDDSKIVEITTEAMAAAAREADKTGTIHNRETNKTAEIHGKTANTRTADENGLDQACGGATKENNTEVAPIVDGIPIEESLFDEDIDDLDDLDELEITD